MTGAYQAADTLELPILVVEDDEGIRILLETRLRRLGFPTVGLGTGAEALSWLGEQTAHLMLLDYSLPDMTGEQAVERLRAGGREVPPFIVVTGHGSETVAVQMMKLGARDYLIKDAGFLDLMPSVVRQVCDQLAQERRLAAAEAELRRSEEFHRTMLESMPTGVVKVLPDGRLQYANAEARRLLRLPAEEPLQGLRASDLQRRAILEDWSPCASRQHPLTRCLQTRQPEPSTTLGLRNSDGSIVWATYTATPLIEPRTGQLDSVVLSFVDVTRMMDADQALRETSESLEHQVRDNTNKLRHLRRRLNEEQELRQRYEMGLLVERQLRQEALLGLQHHHDALLATLTDEILKPLEQINADRPAELAAIVERCRAMGQRQLTEAFQQPLLITAVQRLLEKRAYDDLIPAGAPVPELTCECGYDEPSLDAIVEATGFVIIQELINNLYSHSHAGRGSVKVTLHEDRLHLEVADTGRGFDTAMADLPERGLAAIRQQAESLGGEIDVHSTPGGGTRVRVWLPRQVGGPAGGQVQQAMNFLSLSNSDTVISLNHPLI